VISSTRGRARPLIVAALGGNALLQRNEAAGTAVQRKHAAAAVQSIARLAVDHDVVVTHGNGPQVGLLALQSSSDPSVPPDPLDVLDAETEGFIGYVLEQELENALPGRNVATLLTQVVVDPRDPAFQRPTKPIGPVYDAAGAQRLASARGWTIAPEGSMFRRVVASPEPRDIVELPTIRLLLEAGVIVICVGGGGIPVMVDGGGALRGVEAVIDKDSASSLLAQLLQADALLILTDVDGVQRDFGTPAAERMARATVPELRAMRFASGSMAPKIAAACAFVERTGGVAGIGRLEDANDVLEGRTGTLVLPATGPKPAVT